MAATVLTSLSTSPLVLNPSSAPPGNKQCAAVHPLLHDQTVTHPLCLPNQRHLLLNHVEGLSLSAVRSWKKTLLQITRRYFTLTQVDLLSCWSANLNLPSGKDRLAVVKPQNLEALLAPFPCILLHACLLTYCQLLSFDTLTTAPFSASNTTVVALSIPASPNDQSTSSMYFSPRFVCFFSG